MVKKIFVSFVILFGLLISIAVYASKVCHYLPGVVVCGKGSVHNVLAAGYANLNGTTVTNSIKVGGYLSAKNSNLNLVACGGGVDIDKSNITGSVGFAGAAILNKVSINGKCSELGLLVAKDADFANTIEITGEITHFQHSKTVAILVHPSEHPQEKIYLEDQTVVNGNITFESGNGIVVKSADSTILGNVIGGKIIPAEN
ncbi:MAG: hypothetical protein PVG30_00910 [Gammaproteobacteria bacterium]|jgi:hypothetical protein